MFKGLRTKIESEQKGDKGGSQLKANNSSTGLSAQDTIPKGKTSSNDFIINQKHKYDSINKDSKLDSGIILESTESANQNLSSKFNVDKNEILQQHQHGSSIEPAHHHKKPDKESSQKSNDLLGEITDLKIEISRLHEQLSMVIKERDESNDQNAQLYQLIEKLRRNLENEKEINANLQGKLDKAQVETNNRKGNTGSISIKSFDLIANNNNDDDDNSSDLQKIDNFKRKINELNNQVNDKNRQLKIRQQNLNDIKRALQKELSEHSKTQDELAKVQNQLKQIQNTSSAISTQNDLNDYKSLQNGSTNSDTDSNLKINFNLCTSDKLGQQQQQQKQELNQEVVVSQTPSEDNNQLNNDELGVGLDIGTGSITPQLDKLSYISRSSVSVDEFDSNDLQQNSSNSTVNHEYLKNVLYRYMTSTDRETARHLVKALSVLMNFTPEQSAAVKSAMNSRSSWLRLR